MSFDEGFVLGLQMGGGTGELDRLDVSANGTYHAADYDCDGFEPVVVNLALDSKTATQNGVYTAGNEHLVGYDVFTVALQIVSKTINANGTYTATDPDAGYSPVIVRVPSWRDAKEFYGNGGIGQAGIGGQGYVDQLANDILGNGEHVENTNVETGWRITFEPATSGSHPENGMSIHLRNDTISPVKNYVLKNITSTSSGSMIYRPTHYTIEPYTLGGSQTYIVSYNYRVSFNSGTTWITGTSSSNANLNWNDGYTGYLSGGEYICTVVS